jgi:hypothetical protein
MRAYCYPAPLGNHPARSSLHQETERVQPESANAATHDAITRLLHRLQPSNDHFRSMLTTAKERGFAPRCVVFDS